MHERLKKEETEKMKMLEIESKRRLKITRNVKIVFSIVALLTIISLFANFIIIPEYNKSQAYKNAIKLLEDGKFDEAYNELYKLGEYKNAKEQISENKYIRVERYIAYRDYTLAMDLLNSMLNYKDSEKLKNDVIENMYIQFVDFIETEQYSDAIDYYSKIKKYVADYKDLNSYYNYAIIMLFCPGTHELTSNELNMLVKASNSIFDFKNVEQYTSKLREISNICGLYSKYHDKYSMDCVKIDDDMEIKVFKLSNSKYMGDSYIIDEYVYNMQDGEVLNIMCKTGSKVLKITFQSNNVVLDGINLYSTVAWNKEGDFYPNTSLVGTYTKEY